MEPWHRHLSPPRPADDDSEAVVGAPPAYDDASAAAHQAAEGSHDADSSVYVDDGAGAAAFAQHAYKEEASAAHHMGAAADMLDAAAIGMALQQHDTSASMAETPASADAAADTSYSASPRQPPAPQQHNTPFAKHLGRNRACGACRDRKLKCDGARPVCGQCGRAWAVKKKSMLAKGHSQAEVESIESPCQYISLEPKTQKKRASSSGGANASGSRKKASVQPGDETERENMRLAREVAELRAQLEQQQASSSSSRLPDSHAPQQVLPPQNGSRYQGATSDELSIAEILATTMRAGDGGFTRTTSSPGFDVDGAQRIALDPSLEDFVESLPNIGIHVPANVAGTGVYPHPLPHHAGNRSGEHHSTASIMDNLLGENGGGRGARTSTGGNTGEADPMLELVWSGWPSDFPPPQTVNELVGVFFEKFSYLLIFHPARFMMAMSLGPTNPRYPNPAILHAMFALAYTIRPELDPVASKRSEENSTQRAAQLVVNALATTTNKYLPLAQRLAEGKYDRHQGSPGSAAYHTQRAQHHITHGTWEGGNLYDIMRAATLLCNKKYACGELLDAWMLSAHCTRLLAALGLNRSEKRHTPRGNGRPVEVTRLSMSAPPVDWLDEEERRRATYLVFVTDGSAAATTLWPGSLVEEDVSCDLPVVPGDKWLNSDLSGIDYSQRQTLQSPALLTTQHIDSLSLLIKGFLLVSRAGCLLARLPASPTEDDLITSQFHQLSNSIGSYSMSVPPHLASYAALKADGHVDVALVTAHALPHLATLLLHDPMVNTRNESFTLCSAACSGVLGILRFLALNGEDLALFPAMFTYAISLTGKNIIRRYMRSLATSDRRSQELARSEIDLIIRTLCKYGQRWAIGYRQAHALASELGIDFHPETLSETFGIFDGPQVPPGQGPPQHDSHDAASLASSSPEDFFRAR